MIKPLKILACADIHGDKNLLERLSQQAQQENVDLVIIDGDFSPRNDVDTVPPYLISSFSKHGKQVLLLHGNNESETTLKFLEELYGLKSIHGDYAVFGDVGIFGCGSANVGPFPITEEEIFEKLKQGFQKIKDKPRTIMVTHAHPSGTIMEKFTKFLPPSKAIRRAIDEFKPDIVICGHVHEASGIEETIGKTRVINVAKIGKILEI